MTDFAFTPVETGDTIEAADYNALGYAVEALTATGGGYLYVVVANGAMINIPPGTTTLILGGPDEMTYQAGTGTIDSVSINLMPSLGNAISDLTIVSTVTIQNISWSATLTPGGGFTGLNAMSGSIWPGASMLFKWLPPYNAWMHFASTLGSTFI